MNYKDALELQSMYTTAAQIAKSTNQYEFNYQIKEALFMEFFKKAFPSYSDYINMHIIMKNNYR